MTTMTNARVRALLERQRKLAASMKALGQHIYSTGKAYVPALTKPTPTERPPKADRVIVPIRGRK